MAGRYSGALVRRYYLDVPGDPGAAQPWRHHGSGDHDDDTTARDEAPRGGGWQPDEWDQPVQVGTGAIAPSDDSHQGTGSHIGRDGTHGRAGLHPLSYRHEMSGGIRHHTLDTAGSAGAAHGGLAASGVSAPWANPGGLDLGRGYTPVTDSNRNGLLRFNRPRLTPRPYHQPIREQDGPSPGGLTSPFSARDTVASAGPTMPHARGQIRPLGQVDTLTDDQYDATDYGSIGGGWAL